MRALDLFCGAGGASMGLHRAGFDVTGVDIVPQPRYPFRFVQADALRPPFDLRQFDLIWASPPCQRYSQCTPKKFRANHPDLIGPIRDMLTKSDVSFIIENVPSAAKHLNNPVMLCGSHFGLKIQRHRFFEVSGCFILSRPCNHSFKPVLITGTHRRTYEPRYEYSAQQCRNASGLDWMTRAEMDEAIPPAYSEFLGRQMMKHLQISLATHARKD